MLLKTKLKWLRNVASKDRSDFCNELGPAMSGASWITARLESSVLSVAENLPSQ